MKPEAPTRPDGDPRAPHGLSRGQELRILWLTGVGHGSSHAWELIFPAVAVPMGMSMGLDIEETMATSFLLYLLYGLGAPFAGWAADRWGGRIVLIACLVLGGISGLGVALADGLWLLRLALGGLGLAASLYHPAGLALLAEHFEDRMGRAFAVNGVAGNIGIAATPFLAGLAASLWGWRYAYAALCLPALLFGLGLSLVELPAARRHAREDAAQRAPHAVRVEWRLLACLAVAVTAGGLAYRLHTLVVPALLQQRIPGLQEWITSWGLEGWKNVANLGATALTTVAYAFGIFGQLLGGRIADSKPLAPAYLVFHALGLPLVLAASALSGVGLVLVLFGYLFFAIGMQPIENSLIARLAPPAWRGRVYAGKFVLAFGVGAMGSYVVGWVSPYGGLGASLTTAAALELVLIASVVVLWRLGGVAAPRSVTPGSPPVDA